MPRNTQEIPSQALATFDIQQGPLATTRIAIPAPVVTIGQSAQNDVVIPDDGTVELTLRPGGAALLRITGE